MASDHDLLFSTEDKGLDSEIDAMLEAESGDDDTLALTRRNGFEYIKILLDLHHSP